MARRGNRVPRPSWMRGPSFRLMVAHFAVAAVVGLWWLFGASTALPRPPPDLASLPHVDGTLAVAEPDRLVLRPLRPGPGRGEITFAVRSRERGSFDLQHLRSHAALGVPTRIYYRRDGTRLLALFKDDAPVNSTRKPA